MGKWTIPLSNRERIIEMPEALEVIKRHYKIKDGFLLVGGQVSIEQIIKNFGTPLFLYDANVLDQKFSQLRDALPKEVSISYSVKANPCRPILKHFLGKGCGLEIASGGEFYQACQAGCDPKHIVFAGPGKLETELEEVLGQSIGEVHAESLTEVDRLAKISERLGVRAQVAVRVNPTGEALGGAMRMGGQSTPFGVDEESLGEVIDSIEADPFLEFCGLHLFSGTQILDYSVLISQYRKGLEIARQVAKRINRSLRTLDFGGGWGIPYFAKEQELETSKLATGLEKLFSEVRDDREFSGTHFMVEPGRYLVGEAGIYVSQIIDIKVSRGKKFLIVDGGMHQHLAASGNFGQVIKKNFPVCIVNKLANISSEKVDVVGPLCTPLDILARDVQLPQASIGDWVGVLQSGAYARAASPLDFLSHPSPPEVWIHEGEASLVRRRGTYQDMVADLV